MCNKCLIDGEHNKKLFLLEYTIENEMIVGTWNISFNSRIRWSKCEPLDRKHVLWSLGATFFAVIVFNPFLFTEK